MILKLHLRFLAIFLFTTAVFVSTTSAVSATEFFVSNSTQNQGSDSNNGLTPTTAWKTINFAVNNPSVQPGDTIIVLPGRYGEAIMMDGKSTGRCGSASGGYVTIKAQNFNDKPIITDGGSRAPRFIVQHCSYVKVIGMHFKDFTTGGLQFKADLTSGNTYSHLLAEENVFENQRIDSGSGVWWTTLLVVGGYYEHTNVLEQIFIKNNNFINVRPGQEPTLGENYNEILAMEGRVRRILVEGNTIRDSYGIGIVTKGSSRYTYGTWQVTQAVIRNNTLIDLKRPRIYPSKTVSGNGLYVDGGAYILLERNYVRPGGTISSIGNEPYGTLPQFEWYIYRGNVLDQQTAAAGSEMGHSYPMFLGEGYCGWTDRPPTETMFQTAITHNVIFAAHNYSGVPILFSEVEDIALKNNIYHSQTTNNIYNSSEWATTTEGWESDGNLLCTSGEPKFDWGHEVTGSATNCNSVGAYQSLAAFQQGTGQDTNSILECPIFANSAARDFSLNTNSPGDGDAQALTTTTSPGTNTDLVSVKDAKYFYDGWEIEGEVGDRIKIAGQEARVIDVNYDDNTLKIDRELSFGDEAPVNYYYDGSSPSMGILPDSFYEQTASPPPPSNCQHSADLNNTGTVDILDFHILITDFGKQVDPDQPENPRTDFARRVSNIDCSSDNKVTILDFTVLLQQFGN